MAKIKKTKQHFILSPAQFERLPKIQHFIETGKIVTAEAIAVELECHPKTIYRAIRFLKDRCGHPIISDKKTNRYSYTKKMSPVLPMQVTVEEMQALHMIKCAAGLVAHTPIKGLFDTAFKKIESTMDKAMAFQMKRWQSAISFHDSAEQVVDADMFDALAKAIVYCQELFIIYRKIGSNEKAEGRTIEPLHLAKVDGNWYLFAFDHKWQEERTFFISRRLIEATRTGKTFKRRKFSLPERLKHSFGIRTSKKLHNIDVYFTPNVAEYILEKKWPCQQGLVEFEDGSVELRLLTADLAEPHRWIMTWGGQAVVKRPPELVEMVRKSCYEILAAHCDDPIGYITRMQKEREEKSASTQVQKDKPRPQM